MSLLHLFRTSVHRIWDRIITLVNLYEGKLKTVSIRFLSESRKVLHFTRSHQIAQALVAHDEIFQALAVGRGFLFLKRFLEVETDVVVRWKSPIIYIYIYIFIFIYSLIHSLVFSLRDRVGRNQSPVM